MPSGASTPSALSICLVRGGRPRLPPDGEGRLACPNPQSQDKGVAQLHLGFNVFLEVAVWSVRSGAVQAPSVTLLGQRNAMA